MTIDDFKIESYIESCELGMEDIKRNASKVKACIVIVAYEDRMDMHACGQHDIMLSSLSAAVMSILLDDHNPDTK